MKLLNNINTYIKLIIVNIIIFIVLFFILDFLAFFVIVKTENLNLKIKRDLKKKYLSKIFQEENDLDKYINNKNFRPIENINSNKQPILIFGCSYAYGYMLKENETFSYQLGKLTNRPIYNRAYPGWAPQQMLYQLQNDKFYQIVPKPEYIIYVFKLNHIKRLYFSIDFKPNYLTYKNKKQKLIQNNYPKFIKNSSILYLIKRLTKNTNKYTKKDIEFLKIHFLEAQKEIEKHWGKDIKFVIILYDDNNFDINIIKVFLDLKTKNFIDIPLSTLSSHDMNTKEYQHGYNDVYTFFDTHPNAKAWEVITPLIVKKLNL